MHESLETRLAGTPNLHTQTCPEVTTTDSLNRDVTQSLAWCSYTLPLFFFFLSKIWNSSFQVDYLTSGLYILHWRWCRCKCCRYMHIGKFALITAWNIKIPPLCWNYYNIHHSWIVHRYVSITLFSCIPVKDLQNVSTRCNIRCRLQQSHKMRTVTVPQDADCNSPTRCRLQQSHKMRTVTVPQDADSESAILVDVNEYVSLTFPSLVSRPAHTFCSLVPRPSSKGLKEVWVQD